ncbi:MAG: transcriptional regulator [Rariglobus sp.]|jgi:DNA-binding IclR family transcriptional regulator|nr:transcriptional regulator [Rariglobus sp.]
MPAHTIPVLTKAIAVLRAVSGGRKETTTKALAHELGISHSTVYRILQTLIAEDCVRTSAGGNHELSFGLLPLLQPLARHELLVETARPILSRLAAETGLAAKLSVRQGDQAVALIRAESPRETAVSVRVGSAFHLTLGSSGAVLLSERPADECRRLIDGAPKSCWEHQTRADVEKRIAECRRLGVCSDFGGFRPSVHAMSAPVRDRTGAIVATMTVVGFVQDFEGRKNKAHTRALLAAATVCSQALQGPGSSSLA